MRLISRQVRRRERLSDTDPQQGIGIDIEDERDIESELIMLDLADRVIKVMNTTPLLSDDDRKLLSLWIEGMTATEIARREGIKTNTVHARFSRLRKKLSRVGQEFRRGQSPRERNDGGEPPEGDA